MNMFGENMNRSLETYWKISRKEDGNMKCDICGESTTEEKRICDRCTKIMNNVIREVGTDMWKGVDVCVYIYPMIKRVAEGSLRTQDVINTLLKGETD